jgi:hypothetical protein
VKLFGEHVHSDSLKAIVALSGVTFFLPAFVLSGVTPVVVKQQLQSLTATGATVGRFSAAGTLGALVGTLGTGFFLTSRVHTHTIVLVVGIVLVCLGVLVHRRLNRQASVTAMAAILLILVGGGIASSRVKAPCKVESAYFCINVVGNEQDRGLKLDNLMHSAVELHDHSQLDFFYTRAIAPAADTTFPGHQPLHVLGVGAGAFTLPLFRAEQIGAPTTGAALGSLIGNAQVLTDDFAPVDQLLT